MGIIIGSEISPITRLNTNQFDFAPTFSKNKSIMYFSSTRTEGIGKDIDGAVGEHYTDIFQSTVDKNGNFGEPMPVPGEINTTNNEGTICFDGRGKKMFFTRCLTSENNLGCDIYVATKKGNGFGEATKIELKDHDSTNVGQPSVSPDGNVLVFASNMAGGEGGIDLWLATYDRKSKGWSFPINLGPEINTAGNDMFPTWGDDNELYYASDGMIGAGGLDIFKAKKIAQKNKWISPVNLGAPFNSFADDYHIVFTENNENGIKGVLSSNRPGSKV